MKEILLSEVFFMRSDNQINGKRDVMKKRTFRYSVITLCCLVAVILIAVFTIRANPQWTGNRNDLNVNPQGRANYGEINNDNDYYTNENIGVTQPIPTVDSNNGDSGNGNTTADEGQFMLPVDGTVLLAFSKDIPVYSNTLDQYVSHLGVDIAAAADTPVVAAEGGTVTKVYEDGGYGTTIEITHTGGLITRYSNLSTSKMVEISDVVNKGDVICGVGNSALYESIDPAHLHFEVLKDGEPVDPALYVNLPE